MLTETPKSIHTVSTGQTWTPSLKSLLFLFGGYFLLQAISRGLISETLGMDDAQEVLLAQKWSWGYGPQPPLYTWLVLLFGKVFGLSSFIMALLKNTLLFGIYLLTYLTARRITGSQLAAVTAAVALQFMPSVAYEAHRDLTHSILASLMVMATLFLFFQLQDPDLASSDTGATQSRIRVGSSSGWGTYLLLGLVGGLGILSKYNYAIFYVALILAGISQEKFRPAVLNIRAALALVISLLIAAPNLIWMKTHPDLAFASTFKFDFDSTHSLKGMAHGIGSWASTCVDQVGLLLVVFIAICWRDVFGRKLKISSNNIRLLLRLFVYSGAIIVAGILISGATNCRNRWLQPLVIPAPVLLAALLHEQLDRKRFKAILVLAGAVAIAVTIAAPGRILLTERLRKQENLNTPFQGLARQLQEPLAQSPQLYCNNPWFAGNLRLWFPNKILTAPPTSKVYPPAPGCTLVWDLTIKGSDAFVAQAAHLPGRTPEDAIYFEERLKYHHAKTVRVGVLKPL